MVITRCGRLDFISSNKLLPISSVVLTGASVSHLELCTKLKILASGKSL